MIRMLIGVGVRQRVCDFKTINQNNKVCDCGAVGKPRHLVLDNKVVLAIDLCDKHAASIQLTLEAGTPPVETEVENSGSSLACRRLKEGE